MIAADASKDAKDLQELHRLDFVHIRKLHTVKNRSAVLLVQKHLYRDYINIEREIMLGFSHCLRHILLFLVVYAIGYKKPVRQFRLAYHWFCGKSTYRLNDCYFCHIESFIT